MSRERRYIEIASGIFQGEGKDRERIISRGHRCDYCSGNGYFWGLDADGEHVKQPCRRCKGSGKLDAVITIEWQPSNK